MSAITYAVHTATCTYLLDEEGICRWTHAPTGVAAPGTDRCVGAQFVACLDLLADGGLVGELRLCATALFVRREGGRFVLLRTLPIERVEIREPQAIEDPSSIEETPVVYDLKPQSRLPAFSVSDATPAPPAQARPAGPALPTPPPFAAVAEQTAQLDPRWSPPEELDLEDLLSVSVTEVTLVLPLYRPPPPKRGR